MGPIHIVVPQLVTNLYFPALAADERGDYAMEGLEEHVELLAPASRAMRGLCVDLVDVWPGEPTPHCRKPPNRPGGRGQSSSASPWVQRSQASVCRTSSQSLDIDGPQSMKCSIGRQGFGRFTTGVRCWLWELSYRARRGYALPWAAIVGILA